MSYRWLAASRRTFRRKADVLKSRALRLSTGCRSRGGPLGLLDPALGYLARGWSIIPIGREKRPAIQRWKQFQTNRPTDADLRAWFGNGTKATGLAVIFGDVSKGLVCRDFDRTDGYKHWSVAQPGLA